MELIDFGSVNKSGSGLVVLVAVYKGSVQQMNSVI